MKQKIKQIIELNQKGLSSRKIAVLCGLSKSTVHRILKVKVSQGQSSGGPSVSQIKFEVHDCQIAIPILESPNGWSPNAILGFRKVHFDCIHRNGWDEHFFVYNDVSVHITPYKIIMFPPKIQSSVSAEDAKTMALSVAIELVPKLEELLEIKLSSRPSVWMTISRNHIAMLNDQIFDEIKKAGFERSIDENGNVRLILDNSNGDKHVETVHPVYAESDMNHLEKFLREALTGNFKLVDMKKAIITNQQMLAKLIQDQGAEQDSSNTPQSLEPALPPDYVM